jgi:hypothetical protein
MVSSLMVTVIGLLLDIRPIAVGTLIREDA